MSTTSPLTITQAAEQSGVAANTIHVWEQRYGWPRSGRAKNGYRIYRQSDVDDLRRVKAMIDGGKKIGAIIVDGLPVFEVRQVARARKKVPKFSSIPTPTTDHGRAVRRDLERAILAGDKAGIETAKHLVTTIHPKDRECAVLGVLRLAGLA